MSPLEKGTSEAEGFSNSYINLKTYAHRTLQQARNASFQAKTS